MDNLSLQSSLGETFPEQHPLAHIGSYVSLISFVMLDHYLPQAPAVALIGTGWLLATGVTVVTIGMAAYNVTLFIHWFARGCLPHRQMAAVLAGVSLGSFLVASCFGLGWCWDCVFLATAGSVFMAGLVAGPLVRVGQAMRRRWGWSGQGAPATRISYMHDASRSHEKG